MTQKGMTVDGSIICDRRNGGVSEWSCPLVSWLVYVQCAIGSWYVGVCQCVGVCSSS